MSVTSRKLLELVEKEEGSYLQPRGSFAQFDPEELQNDGDPNEYDGILGKEAEPSFVMSSNVEASILEHQEMLKYTPLKRTPEKNPKYAFEVVLQTEVRVQKVTMSNVQWKRYIMTVAESVMYLKEEGAAKNVYADRICYISADELNVDHIPDQSVADLYLGFLERQSARFAVRVYTPRKIMLLVTDSIEERNKIVSVVSEHLRTVFSDALWQEKIKAEKELEPLLKEQFVADIHRQETVIKALAQSGIVGEDAILLSPKKDKSGVLKMYQHNELMDRDEDHKEAHNSSDWVDYYFVLMDDVLYYFLHSKATLPTGFVSLKYAAVDLDKGSLLRGEYIFTISTPIRVMTLMTKHAVSLSTWISALEKAVLSAGRSRGSVLSPQDSSKILTRRDSNAILQEIEKLQSPVESLSMLLKNHEGVRAFREFLATIHCENDLECLKEIKALAAIDSSNSTKREEHAKMIYDRFLSRSASEKIATVSSELAEKMGKLDSVSVDSFKELWQFVVDRLKVHFEKFKEAPECASFLKLFKGALHPDERKIEPFDVGDKCLGFQIDLKSKGSKVKIVRFDMAKDVLTVGRDVSNDLVVDDERVSRSHARVEYSRTHCKYLDLGSAHGSKLNGQRFTTANLQIGDSVRIGSTTMRLLIVEQTLFKKVLDEVGGLFGRSKAVV